MPQDHRGRPSGRGTRGTPGRGPRPPRRRARRRLRGPARIIALNKPFRVMCQFRPVPGRLTLADYVPVPEVYPAGRLDYDSEGLVILTNDPGVQFRLADRAQGTTKTYLAQVEGLPDAGALATLRTGVVLDGRRTRQASARWLEPPGWLWVRAPPIRHRANIPTTWLELVLTEGRNRQVRRMTAAVGHPTLRLIRTCVGPYRLADLRPGAWTDLEVDDPRPR